MSRIGNQYFKPGQMAPVGGLYVVVGPGGRLTGDRRLLAEGRRFPPTPKRRQHYVLLGLRMASDQALRNHRRLFRRKSAILRTGTAGA